MKKLIGKNDIILIGALLAALAAMLCILLVGKRSGSFVVVSVDSGEVISFPLSQDVVYEIEGYDGGRNTLVIENGRAWLEDSTCPDHLCEHMGKIDTAGQSVICLPNRVVVEVRGVDDTGEYDTISS